MYRIIRTFILIAVSCSALSALGGCSSAPGQVQSSPAPAVSAVDPTVSQDIGDPLSVSIPSLGIDQPISGVGLEPDGAMTTPPFGQIGWYDRGPVPGEAGPAVIVAHVHGPAGDDVFAELHTLEPGDEVTVTGTDSSATFAVLWMESTKKEELPVGRIWSGDARPVLRLITCGGTPDPVTRMYPLNTIVYAERVA